MNLDAVEFARNPEPRCPCVLLLDTSGSMTGNPITKLNEGLQVFKQSLLQDDVAAKRVEIAIVTFASGVNVAQDFVTADQFMPTELTSGGSTSMGAGIQKALDMVNVRKQLYKANGVTYYRPWVFMITDGAPTDDVQEATKNVHKGEDGRRVAFFAVGVEGADMAKLKIISMRAPMKLHGLNFAEMFLWLSSSMQEISHSSPGEQVPLVPPGWGSV